MSKFKVGDRVVALDNYTDGLVKGLCGTIKLVEKYGIGVEFDKPFKHKQGGHLCGHTLLFESVTYAVNKHGWWMHEDLLELVKIKEEPPTPPTAVVTPALTPLQALKCRIAKASYPFATLDSNGDLSFYSEPPTIPYFETAKA